MLKIKEIREKKNITQDEIVNNTGIPKRSYVDYENQKQDIPLERLRKIASALNVTVGYLIGEENNKLNNTQLVAEPIKSYRKTKDKIHEIQRIPVFNLEATMGLVPLVDDNGLDEEKIVDYISVPSMAICDGAIYASGDSMYPLLKAGDIVAYKKIEINPDTIFFGEIYILALFIDETTTMKTIKFVQKSEKGDDWIKLVSQNSHHADKDIKLNQIAAMGLVRASIRLHN
ncbi:XRE family transcriptional regulator [Empedobacter falsenii]|uniref:LexA family transcriptional regulator n=1 Tax=Empedobacter falsenii TaxID=343874 RepID=A0AAW7DG20_9FLAO|nr:LexA family transcriptional regulator [Empedobacter falsenii]MDM1550623.1 LexA family transcriptional regulator [Empedobacter falsenii]